MYTMELSSEDVGAGNPTGRVQGEKADKEVEFS